MPNKRRKRNFTVREKIDIIEKYDKLPNMSKYAAAKELRVNRNTLLNFLRNRDEILKRDSQNSAMKRTRRSKLKRRNRPIGEDRDVIEQYDKLPVMSQSRAAKKLGNKRSTLLRNLADRGKILKLNSTNLEIVKRANGNCCQFCPFIAIGKSKLERHVKTVHLKLGDLECEKCCNFKASDISKLREHIRDFHRIKNGTAAKEKTDLSSKALRKESYLKNHLCGLCPSSLSTRQGLYHHLTYYHMEMEIGDNKRIFKCDQQKNKKHESIKSFKCQVCEYATNNNKKLNKHMEKAHDNEVQESIDGGENKTEKVALNKTSDFTCGICHTSFRDDAALFSHLGEDNHDDINGQKEEGLKISPVVVNRKMKNHLCGLCTDSMATRQDLCSHLKKVHSVELPSSVECELIPKQKSCKEPGESGKITKNRQHCPFCPFTAPYDKYLRRHVKAVHHKIRDLKCDQCDYDTPDASNLRSHYKNKHEAAIRETGSALRVRFKKKYKTDMVELVDEEKTDSSSPDKAAHDSAPNFTCGLCSCAFYEEEGLFKHLREYTHDEINIQKELDNESEDDDDYDSGNSTGSIGKEKLVLQDADAYTDAIQDGEDYDSEIHPEDQMEPEMKAVHSLNDKMINKEQEIVSDFTKCTTNLESELEEEDNESEYDDDDSGSSTCSIGKENAITDGKGDDLECDPQDQMEPEMKVVQSLNDKMIKEEQETVSDLKKRPAKLESDLEEEDNESEYDDDSGSSTCSIGKEDAITDGEDDDLEFDPEDQMEPEMKVVQSLNDKMIKEEHETVSDLTKCAANLESDLEEEDNGSEYDDDSGSSTCSIGKENAITDGEDDDLEFDSEVQMEPEMKVVHSLNDEMIKEGQEMVSDLTKCTVNLESELEDNESEYEADDSGNSTCSIGKEDAIKDEEGNDLEFEPEDQLEPEMKAVHSLNDEMINEEQESVSDLIKCTANLEPELDTTNMNVIGENLSISEEEYESDDDELLEQLMEIVPSSSDEMFKEGEEVPVSSPVEEEPEYPAGIKDPKQCPIDPEEFMEQDIIDTEEQKSVSAAKGSRAKEVPVSSPVEEESQYPGGIKDPKQCPIDPEEFMEQDIMDSEEQKSVSDVKGNRAKHRKKCRLCPFTAVSNAGVKRHLKAVHYKIKDLKCDRCDLETSDQSVLRKHYKKKHETAINESGSALRVRFRKGDTTDTVEWVDEEKTGSRTPDRAVQEESNLRLHSKRKHQLAIHVKSTGPSEMGEVQMNAHEEPLRGENFKIDPKGPFPPTDEKNKEEELSVLDLSKYSAHQLGATNKNASVGKTLIRNKTFACDKCDHKTSSRNHLEEHVKVIHDMIIFSCQKCDYKTTSNRVLRKHEQRVHNGIIKGKPAKRRRTRRTKVKILV